MTPSISGGREVEEEDRWSRFTYWRLKNKQTRCPLRPTHSYFFLLLDRCFPFFFFFDNFLKPLPSLVFSIKVKKKSFNPFFFFENHLYLGFTTGTSSLFPELCGPFFYPCYPFRPRNWLQFSLFDWNFYLKNQSFVRVQIFWGVTFILRFLPIGHDRNGSPKSWLVHWLSFFFSIEFNQAMADGEFIDK